MSAAEAWSLAIAVVILAAVGAFLYWIWRTGDRCKGRPYMRARFDDRTKQWVNEEPHDVGPDPLRLLQDLEADLKAYAATVADFYDTTTGGSQ